MATITSGLGKLVMPAPVSVADSPSLYVRLGKRLFDIFASLACLVISSPILVLCALLVRQLASGISGGPLL
jgi:lipopolysaccharide/colanic/teichoic acid biosynthesis glycosyltransferase